VFGLRAPADLSPRIKSVKLAGFSPSEAFPNAELEPANAPKPPVAGSFGVVGGVVLVKALDAGLGAKGEGEAKADFLGSLAVGCEPDDDVLPNGDIDPTADEDPKTDAPGVDDFSAP
jgi:hypothetical protein